MPLSLPRRGSARFLRFALVGCAGFLVDSGVLAGLHHGIGLDPFTSRILSIAAAALSTWRLNRLLTFGASPTGQAREGLRYGLVAGLTACLNYGVYCLALLLLPGVPPVVAAAAATLVAMGFSYLGYSRFAFGGARSAVLVPPRSQSR